MTIVVAGGTGLAGSAIVRAYVAAGHEVIPVSRKVVDLLDRDGLSKSYERNFWRTCYANAGKGTCSHSGRDM